MSRSKDAFKQVMYRKRLSFRKIILEKMRGAFLKNRSNPKGEIHDLNQLLAAIVNKWNADLYYEGSDITDGIVYYEDDVIEMNKSIERCEAAIESTRKSALAHTEEKIQMEERWNDCQQVGMRRGMEMLKEEEMRCDMEMLKEEQVEMRREMEMLKEEKCAKGNDKAKGNPFAPVPVADGSTVHQDADKSKVGDPANWDYFEQQYRALVEHHMRSYQGLEIDVEEELAYYKNITDSYVECFDYLNVQLSLHQESLHQESLLSRSSESLQFVEDARNPEMFLPPSEKEDQSCIELDEDVRSDEEGSASYIIRDKSSIIRSSNMNLSSDGSSESNEDDDDDDDDEVNTPAGRKPFTGFLALEDSDIWLE